MANEKEFGQMIDPEGPAILDSEDLLHLQPKDRWGIEGFEPACTVCTYTCNSATSVVE
jgi:hypothetical protein